MKGMNAEKMGKSHKDKEMKSMPITHSSKGTKDMDTELGQMPGMCREVSRKDNMRKKIEKDVTKIKNKKVEKIMDTPQPKNKERRLVHINKVGRRKEEGWKIVGDGKAEGDLVLMERSDNDAL